MVLQHHLIILGTKGLKALVLQGLRAFLCYTEALGGGKAGGRALWGRGLGFKEAQSDSNNDFKTP